jgi:hypothetical protein
MNRKINIVIMKIYHFVILSLIGSILLAGCGKPSTPESLKDNKYTGGYKIVKKFMTTGFAQDLAVKNNLAYIAQGEVGLMIVDISNPSNPKEVSTTTDNVRGYSAKIALKDTVVYLAAGSFGITVINVSDPAQPKVTASNISIKPTKNITVSENYLFAAISEQGVKIADISYPTQPDPRGRTHTSGYARDISITSDLTKMMVACGEMGLAIYDITNFQDGFGEYPLLASCNTPGYTEAIVINEEKSLAYMACGTFGLQIIDYSDISNVHIVGSCDEGGFAKDLLYKDGKIYMATELGGLQIIDVKDPANPYLYGTILTEYALGVDIDDKYVYLADESEGLIIISIPDNDL